jgi:hypothetical protein
VSIAIQSKFKPMDWAACGQHDASIPGGMEGVTCVDSPDVQSRLHCGRPKVGKDHPALICLNSQREMSLCDTVALPAPAAR